MNGNRQMEMHYINTGFPYNHTESFMNFFFEDQTHPNVPYAHMGSIHDQEAAYWSMNMNYYKFGLPGPTSTPYYGLYEVSDYLPRLDLNRRAWEYPTVTSVEETAVVDVQSGANSVSSMQAIPEECVSSASSPENESSSEVVWQDGIDPDNMTYEELLDLGETVGTQSRGLSDEHINMLPTSRYKSGGFFLRKKSAERCVICQMRYKRGERQIHLPCKHVYHTKCGSKWLSINKTCPICNIEVFVEEAASEEH